MVGFVLTAFVVVLPHFLLPNFSAWSLVLTSESQKGFRPEVAELEHGQEFPDSETVYATEEETRALTEGLDNAWSYTILGYDKLNAFLRLGFKDAAAALVVIDEEFDRFAVDANASSTELHFKMNVAAVQALSQALKTYTAYPNKITRDLFEGACRNYWVLDVAGWILREVTRKNVVQPFMGNLDRMDKSRERFAWSTLLALTYMKGSILSDVCLGTVYANETNLGDTRTIFRKASMQGMKEIDEILVRYCAMRDVRDLLSTISSEDDVVDNVTSFLWRRYPGRYWLVSSYAGHMVHDNLRNENVTVFFLIQPHHNTTFLVSSSDLGELNVLFKRVVKCMYWDEPKPCGEYCSCEEYVDVVRECSMNLYQGLPYRDIFCDESNFRQEFLKSRETMNGRYFTVTLYECSHGFASRYRPDENCNLAVNREVYVSV